MACLLVCPARDGRGALAIEGAAPKKRVALKEALCAGGAGERATAEILALHVALAPGFAHRRATGRVAVMNAFRANTLEIAGEGVFRTPRIAVGAVGAGEIALAAFAPKRPGAALATERA